MIVASVNACNGAPDFPLAISTPMCIPGEIAKPLFCIAAEVTTILYGFPPPPVGEGALGSAVLLPVGSDIPSSSLEAPLFSYLEANAETKPSIFVGSTSCLLNPNTPPSSTFQPSDVLVNLYDLPFTPTSKELPSVSPKFLLPRASTPALAAIGDGAGAGVAALSGVPKPPD